jgi:hypothetical protein
VKDKKPSPKKPIRINRIYILAGCILTIIYSGCHNSNSNNNTPQKVSLIQLLVGNGNKLFRSVDLGADFKTVLNSEKKIPDENDTDDISYSLPIDTLRPDSVNETIDSVNYFTLTYYFDKEKLNEVDECIYLASDSTAANLLQRLTNYLSSKYGDYTSQNDSRVWRVKKDKKDWVSLSDQSEEYDNGKILLVFWGEDY